MTDASPDAVAAGAAAELSAADILRAAQCHGWPMTAARADDVADAARPTLALLRRATAGMSFDQTDDFGQALLDCRQQEPAR